jgi:colanic acid/amylovoran biosynthesis protein
MEYGNLGNYAIIEPFVRQLHRVFPDARIRTTFQMSSEFCSRERIETVPMDLYYGWKPSDLWTSLYEAASSWLSRYLHFVPLQTSYIREVLASDLVIDFSGDIWGANASLVGKNRFLVGILKDLTAHLLGKPVAMIAGSPGPFPTRWSHFLAGLMLRRFDLVTTREDRSRRLLAERCLPVENVRSLACPAFLFEARSEDEMRDVYARERLRDGSRPTVGFVACGWNLPIGPFDRSPRDDSEFLILAQTVEFIEAEIGARVCVLSHNNGFIPPPNFRITKGRDHEICRQLLDVLRARGRTRHVFTLQGLYDCAQTKAIICQFDMLVSGRIHAAVSGLSQFVPTVIIDYGHEPKAHKLRGFAAVAGVSEFVADPANLEDLIGRVRDCWARRNQVREDLRQRIPEVRKLAAEHFDLLRSLVDEVVPATSARRDG